MQTNDLEEENIFTSKFPDIEFPNVSVGEYCYEKVKQHENKILLIDAQTNESLTGKQLITSAQNLSVALLKRGITKSDIVLFHSPNSLPHAITKYAAYFLGLTITPSKPTHGIYEIENQIIDSGASLIFTSVAAASTIKQAVNKTKGLKQVKYVFVFDGEFDGFESYEKLLKEGLNQELKRIPYFPIDPKNDITIIAYTSGTTGLPKGALTTHQAFVACFMVYDKYCVIKKESVFSGIYPFGHITGSMFLPLLTSIGGTLVLISDLRIESILEAIQKFKITLLALFPGFGAALLEKTTEKYDLSSLVGMCSGGSAFPAGMGQKLIKKFHLKHFIEFFGMTETIGSTTNFSEEYIPGNVGEIGPNMQLKIVDIQTIKNLGINCEGEICFRGPIMFKGYLNNPSATSATIDKNGWLHTGDVGRIDQNGHIFITDRLKELIKFKMFTIFPAEIEDCLLRHPAVAESAVIGVKHVKDGQWLRAYVVLKKGFNISPEEIQTFISDRMASQKQLRAGVVFVDRMPRTIIGKLDRQYFKNMAKDELLTEIC